MPWIISARISDDDARALLAGRSPCSTSGRAFDVEATNASIEPIWRRSERDTEVPTASSDARTMRLPLDACSWARISFAVLLRIHLADEVEDPALRRVEWSSVVGSVGERQNWSLSWVITCRKRAAAW